MGLNIGENIRRLRREHDITQERLAEYLDVSHQAVSKWETGAVLPDVTLLPKIANIFGVSMDILFGMDNMPPAEEINKILSKVVVLSIGHQFIEAEAILREALDQYPNSYHLMVQLSTVLRNKYKEDISEDKSLLKESIKRCTCVLNECNDDALRYKARRGIAISYAMLGDQERAIEAAKSIPITDDILLYVLAGDERIHRCQQNIFNNIKKLVSSFTHLAELVTSKGKENDALYFLSLAENIISLVFENNDYYEITEIKNSINYAYAKIYALLNQNERCFDHLRKYVIYNCNPDNFPKNVKYTSRTFNMLESVCGEEYRIAMINEIRYSLKNPVFNTIRETQDFRFIENMLN